MCLTMTLIALIRRCCTRSHSDLLENQPLLQDDEREAANSLLLHLDRAAPNSLLPIHALSALARAKNPSLRRSAVLAILETSESSTDPVPPALFVVLSDLLRSPVCRITLIPFSKSDEDRLSAASALSNLSAVPDNRQSLLDSTDLIFSFLTQLKSKNQDVLLQLVGVITNISSEPGLRERLLLPSPDFISPIMEIASHQSIYANIVRNAVGVLLNLTHEKVCNLHDTLTQ